MINFRVNADMFVCVPKVQLAHYVDNTMPRRDWSKFDEPTYLRRQRALNGEHKHARVSNRETASNLVLRRQAS